MLWSTWIFPIIYLYYFQEDILQPVNGDDDDDDPSFETNNLKLIFPPKMDENSKRLWMDILATIYSKWQESRPAKDLDLLSKRSRFLSAQVELITFKKSISLIYWNNR